jgi:hypothetical protein
MSNSRKAFIAAVDLHGLFNGFPIILQAVPQVSVPEQVKAKNDAMLSAPACIKIARRLEGTGI